MVCTFFGHANAPEELTSTLRLTLIDLIENKNVNLFYVGNNGNFDSMVRNQLEKLSTIYSIKYYVVLAYPPYKQSKLKNSLLPEGIEELPPKYAIPFRNEWMIKKSDYVVTYVKRTFGGAYKFKNLSVTQNKIVIKIADLPQSKASQEG